MLFFTGIHSSSRETRDWSRSSNVKGTFFETETSKILLQICSIDPRRPTLTLLQTWTVRAHRRTWTDYDEQSATRLEVLSQLPLRHGYFSNGRCVSLAALKASPDFFSLLFLYLFFTLPSARIQINRHAIRNSSIPSWWRQFRGNVQKLLRYGIINFSMRPKEHRSATSFKSSYVVGR